jgi:hypothetical protein
LTILSWVTAYHSFSGEVEASNTPTIRRLTPSRRHQLPRITHYQQHVADPEASGDYVLKFMSGFALLRH